MKKRVETIWGITGSMLAALIFLFVLAAATTGAAQDLDFGAGADSFINANILYAAANIDSNRFSISYDGRSDNGKVTSESIKSSRSIDIETRAVLLFEPASKEDMSIKVARKLKGAADYILRYVKVGGFSSDDPHTALSIKSKVKTDRVDHEAFDFNLSLALGQDENKIINMEAINLESHWNHTFVNAVYHCGNKEIELGLSNSYINKYLLKGMKLEFQATPNSKSGVILLTKSL